MGAAESEGVAVSRASLQLIREWSDPVAIAHPGWFVDTPSALLGAAMRSPAGRRHLARQLRHQVPLPARWSAAACDAFPCALGDGPQLMALAEHAGWLLLRPQVARVVSRRGIECIVAQVGRSRYEAVFATAVALWQGDEPPDLPDLASVAAGPAGDVAAVLRSVGWRAVNQAFGDELAALRGRMHLVSGPLCAIELAVPPWRIDVPRLIEALRGFGNGVWH